MKNLICAICLLLPLMSCEQTKYNSIIDNFSIKDTVIFGEPFELQFGNCVFIKDIEYPKISNKITINNNFYKVCILPNIIDKRCYKSACKTCYGSFAYITVGLINSVNDTLKINLSIIGCVDEASSVFAKDTLGFNFLFMRLYPYPDSNNVPIDQHNYFVKLKILKQ